MCDVAIVCGAGMISGKEVMTLELVRGLREQGKTVDVVTSFWGEREFRSRCEKLGARVHMMRLGFISATVSWPAIRMTLHQLLHWPGALIAYSRFLKRTAPRKIIHTNWHHLLLLGPLLKPHRDVFWVHEVIPNNPRYRKFFLWLARRLQCFVAVSEAVAGSLRKIDIDQKNIRVVHNGIRDPAGDFEPARSERDKLVVGIVGQVGARKGHEDLLEAFAIAASEFAAAELHLFGQAPTEYIEYLRDRARQLGIGEKIVWHGFVGDRTEIYREMDVCVVPSRVEEPLPTVAIEAAFFSIPVVATRQGGLSEIVEDAVTGFLVEASQPAEIASRLKMLLSDEALRRGMGENARRRAIERFNSKRFIEDFLEVMEEK
ncbi:MAG TPA: glycosyltransferase family 4 protein [Chthoniobacterales bacterium]|jgi:glycosyltransferase involved in cell wall biosynthesis